MDRAIQVNSEQRGNHHLNSSSLGEGNDIKTGYGLDGVQVKIPPSSSAAWLPVDASQPDPLADVNRDNAFSLCKPCQAQTREERGG